MELEHIRPEKTAQTDTDKLHQVDIVPKMSVMVSTSHRLTYLWGNARGIVQTDISINGRSKHDKDGGLGEGYTKCRVNLGSPHLEWVAHCSEPSYKTRS